MRESLHPCDGARVALLTRHGKAQVLGPLLSGAGLRVEVVDDFDTDQLGTFTRDVPRFGSQRDAARKKAQLAIERSGAPWGLGSEGSFGPGPLGLGSWNLELVVLTDARGTLELVGRAHAPGLHHHGVVSTLAGLAQLAERAGFPEHALVLRPDGPDDRRIRKALRSWPDLAEAFAAAQRESWSGGVFVENDLRAHQHPTRMATIARAGRDLVERLASPCPSCGSPGFGAVEPVPGLPCRDCGAPTREPVADALGCVRCELRTQRPRAGAQTADPAACEHCNP